MTTLEVTIVTRVTRKYTNDLGEGCEGMRSIRVHGGRGGEQTAGVVVLGGMEELCGWSLFHDAAQLHDGDVVCDLAYDGEVVRDEEHCE